MLNRDPGGTPTPEAAAFAARDEATQAIRARAEKRIRELDAAMQATTNIATRYDIKIRIEELMQFLKSI